MTRNFASASASTPRLAHGALYSLLCLALLFVWGCDSKPTQTDGESALRKHVDDKLHGMMQLATFRTTDGQDSEANGVKTYRLNYEGQFKILQPCSYNVVDGNLVLADGGSNTVQPGDLLRVQGQLFFEKSESGWTLASARIEPKQLLPLVAAPAPAHQSEPGSGKSNNIFGTNFGTPPPLLDTSTLPRDSHPNTHHETPGASAVVVPAAAIPEPVGPTVQAARAKLDAATALVEKLLAKNPEYRIAKADADEAAARVDRARADAGPGSPEIVEAARQSLEAKSKLKKIFDEIAAKEPAYAAAQREFAAAQARARGTR